ncbi:MAG: hypothetical protein JSU07_03675 [Bacteroidetes bacterium]|nr:hypothetical protein [Bacteroidota bacterium]
MRKLFDIEQIHDFKFGGVYTIYKIDADGNEEIVKYGESDFILRRLSNYLIEFKTKKAESRSRSTTKSTILQGIKQYKKSGCQFYVDWIVENNKGVRRKLEKDLIQEFVTKNKRLPIFHQIAR